MRNLQENARAIAKAVQAEIEALASWLGLETVASK